MPVSAVGLVLLVDRADVLGFAAAAGEESAAVDAAVAVLTAALPGAPLFVVRTATDAASLQRAPTTRADQPRHVLSPFHTDARRLGDLRAQRFAHVLVARPAVAALPAEVVRDALDEAARRGADLLRIDGIPDDVAYVASAGLLRDVLALGAVPAALTLPDVVERLQRARSDAVLPWRVVGARTARRSSLEAGGTVATGRVSEAPRPRPASAREVVVALPSPYQTGAHFAWRAVLDDLDAARVAFVVSQGTVLSRDLEARRFATMLVEPRWLASPHVLREWDEALDVLRPSVVHFDGAECTPLVTAVRRRGARVVAHVRLTTVDRFLPLCAQADAVVAVSLQLRDRLREQLGDRPAVAHVADGVRIEDHHQVLALGDRPLRLLCVGRVEPSKDQLRVLDIVEAVVAYRSCELRLVGPCGNDVAYADEVTARLRALPAAVRAAWMPFADPVAPHYAWADVVLVASRNEALGMVGLETLAAGRLLVAQRSSGYAEIIDEEANEGLLFDRDETPSDIAARIAGALASYGRYADAARRKARTHFDARLCVARLARIWDVE